MKLKGIGSFCPGAGCSGEVLEEKLSDAGLSRTGYRAEQGNSALVLLGSGSPIKYKIKKNYKLSAKHLPVIPTPPEAEAGE